jgi:phosphatidylglycerol:prolipoprotein diacylglycerol transferase
MFPYVHLFGLALPVPAITILIGIWAGITLAERHARDHRVKPADLYNLIFYSLISGIIGGRLAYVLQFPSAFLENPISLISPNPGLFDLFGGIVVGLITAEIYRQRKKMPLWPTLDTLTPALAVIQIALPIANLASGDAYGAPTSLPWGIELWGEIRHPTQIYESLTAGVILWQVWPGRGKEHSKPGEAFLQFISYSAMARLFLEAFRGDSLVTIFNLRVAQIIAWIILAISLCGLYYLNKDESAPGKNPVQ